MIFYRRRFFLKQLLFSLIPLFVITFYKNENTSSGDEFRHRPLWLKPFTFLIPNFTLKKEWFLQGDEDETALRGLEIVIESLNNEAELNSFGKLFVSTLLYEQLHQRSCIINEINNKDKLNDISKLPPPIVVLGLPRTGTTFMHGLLGESSNHRVPRLHEYMHSCPHRGGYGHKLRVYLQGIKMFALRKLMPSMKSIHFIGADSPEEDIIALGQEMVSMMILTTFYVPHYSGWLQRKTSKKLLDSVKYLHLFLDQHLRDENETRPWILKTPWHLTEIEEFHQVFPGTKFVWLHRHPIDTLSSLIDLVLSLNGIGSDKIKTEAGRKSVATDTIDFWFWALERGVEARNANSEIQFLDVTFERLNEDPVGVATSVFTRFGQPVSEELQQKFVLFSKNNVKTKRGVHKHSLRFGINVTEVEARYYSIINRIQNMQYV